ncbi:MAG: hypothetical protein K2I87_07195 [Bacteroidales bacterium]|nr:hypothetical protein [Bacteroidales bacterium]
MSDIKTPKDTTAVTETQIKEWKRKFGKILCYEVDGEKIYFKRPDRKVLASASLVAKNDPVEYSEFILNNCFIGGNKELLYDDSVFLGLMQVIDQFISIKVGELKNL